MFRLEIDVSVKKWMAAKNPTEKYFWPKFLKSPYQ